MELTDEKRLKLLFHYAINPKSSMLIIRNLEQRRDIDAEDVHFADAKLLVQYMIDLYDYNRFPRIVKTKEYNRINSPIIYRGVKNPAYALNLVNDFNYHYGSGCGVDGMYFADKSRTTSSFGKFMFQAKLSPDTKVADRGYRKLIEAYYNHKEYDWEDDSNLSHEKFRRKMEILIKFCNSLENDKQRKLFMELFMYNNEVAWIYLGFDAYKNSYNDRVVFNRGKLILSEAEARRIDRASAEYLKTDNSSLNLTW